jgi:hypothetical protein
MNRRNTAFQWRRLLRLLHIELTSQRVGLNEIEASLLAMHLRTLADELEQRN